jgi:hypothetical protein
LSRKERKKSQSSAAFTQWRTPQKTAAFNKLNYFFFICQARKLIVLGFTETGAKVKQTNNFSALNEVRLMM